MEVKVGAEAEKAQEDWKLKTEAEESQENWQAEAQKRQKTKLPSPELRQGIQPSFQTPCKNFGEETEGSN